MKPYSHNQSIPGVVLRIVKPVEVGSRKDDT